MKCTVTKPKKRLYVAVSLLFLISASITLSSRAQEWEPAASKKINKEALPWFREAYRQYPQLPPGLLEALAWTRTRMENRVPDPDHPSCSGMPQVYGVMGLVKDGKQYFQNTLPAIAQASGFSEKEILASPQTAVLAYARALYFSVSASPGRGSSPYDYPAGLRRLSELPQQTPGQQFAADAELYSVFSFINDAGLMAQCGYAPAGIDLERIFGADNLKVLSAATVVLENDEVKTGDGMAGYHGPAEYHAPAAAALPPPCAQGYASALWTASPNFSSRGGTAISAITVHDTEGSYAGSISWFQNTASQVSAHYVLRSSDGQITMMVCEENKAWHVGSENPYTIGLEHEGFANSSSWYTTAMYAASANLVKDICNNRSYGIPKLRTNYFPWSQTSTVNALGACVKIKGHQHFPNQNHHDPGQYWNWDYYYKLINSATPVTTLTAASGTITDNGGAGNYPDDQRTITVISPPGASQVTLSFTQFATELNYDYLYIYNGNSVNAPLIGRYNGSTSPGTVSSTGGSITVEFRSDCATTGAGYSANWSSTAPGAACASSIWAYEPNNATTEATVMTSGTTYNAAITSNVDVDYFRITTTAAAPNLRVTLSNLPLNYDLTLYNSAGTQLAISQNAGTAGETIIRNSATAATYYIKVSGSGGVFTQSLCYNLLAQTSGASFRSSTAGAIPDEWVAEPVEGELHLAPNPAKNNLGIRFAGSQAGRGQMRIMSGEGRIVLQLPLSVVKGMNFRNQDISHLSNGLYIVQISPGDGSILTQKLLVQR